MGQRGRAYYRERLSFASAMEKTLAVLGDAIGRSTA
jgi:hypothetical protein